MMNNLTRPERVKQIREYHQPVLNKLLVPKAYFDLKSYREVDGYLRVGFFESQLKIGGDIYFEITDFNQIPTDKERKLYKLTIEEGYRDNPKYLYKPNTPAGPQYYIKADEFEIISVLGELIEIKDDFINIIEELEDDNMSKMTVRDFACIILKLPKTNKLWLNKLITEKL